MGVEIGALYLRRSAFIKASPDRVWEEFTGEDRLRAWFGRGHVLDTFEPRLGGTIRLHITVDGEEVPFGGKVLAFEPGQELSFESDWENNDRFPPCFTTITFRLTPLGNGTHVELFDHGYEQCGEDAGQRLEEYEQGWTNHHLVALRKIIEN